MNNAGTVKMGTIETMSMDDIDFQYKVNLRAPLYLTQLCIPHLKQNKGELEGMTLV